MLGAPSMFRNALGGALIASFIGAMITLFIVPIPPENEQLITYMLGQISGFAGGIVSYHYASTASSAQKNELLARKETEE